MIDKKQLGMQFNLMDVGQRFMRLIVGYGCLIALLAVADKKCAQVRKSVVIERRNSNFRATAIFSLP